MRKTVIVLTGPMAAGKGGLKDWAHERGIPFISMSELIEADAGKPKEEIGREGMQEFANNKRAIRGADHYARRTGQLIDESNSALVIVDGMRNVHECEYFRNTYQTAVIGIVPTSPEQEFENIQRRSRPGDPESREQFECARRKELGADQGEEGQHVDACLKLADATIVNEHGEDGRQQVAAKFDAVLRELGIAVRP